MRQRLHKTWRAATLVLAVYLCAVAVRIIARKYYVFLADYTSWAIHRTEPTVSAAAPTHVFFVIVDHFEPGGDVAHVRQWLAKNAELARRHHDSTGRPLQHTWFYPGEQYDEQMLRLLKQPVSEGLGEVELHYHHGGDTEATLRPKLALAIQQFQQFGYLKTVDGRTAWAFVHGNSGLDNSNGPEFCGVDTELRVIHELGGFADFTFPSLYLNSQPEVVNRLFMAADDPRPKSYARALAPDAPGDLLIFEGPLVLSPSLSLRHLFVDVDDGNLHGAIPPSPARVDRWIWANIHVPDRPDWVFVKVFTHGIQSSEDMDAIFGPAMDRSLDYLEHRYNDGSQYVLHYVTAREAYNLAWAAARGATGNPEMYRNAAVKPYVADGPAAAAR